MKANEYIKQSGINKAKKGLKLCIDSGKELHVIHGGKIDLDDLKRLVDSHDLVEECGGLDKAKERVALEEKSPNPNVFYVLVVSGAIDDVESCQ